MSGTASQAHQRAAARHLAGQAHQVQRVDGGWRRREVLRRLSRGRYGRQKAWPHIPELDSPWQDTVAAERDGWRTRAANLEGEADHAFAIDCAPGH